MTYLQPITTTTYQKRFLIVENTRTLPKNSPNNRTKKEKKELRSKSKFQNAGPSVDKNSVSNLAPNRKAIPGMGNSMPAKKRRPRRKKRKPQA